MLGTNAFLLLEIERKREDVSKTKVARVAEIFYKWTVPLCKRPKPFCSREGAQRPSYAQVRTIETRLFPYPFSRQEFQLPSIRRATRFVQPGETSTTNKNNFRDCLWLRDRINIAESKVSWRKHGVANCVSYTHSYT